MTTTTPATMTEPKDATPANAGHAGGVRWLPVREAAAELGRSERTVRRWVAEGRVRSRTMNGAAEVGIDADTTPATPDGGERPTPVNAGHWPATVSDRHSADIVAGGVSALVSAVQGHAAELRTEARRARRSAAIGWTAAAGLLVGACAGAVWSVRSIDAATSSAAVSAAETRAARASVESSQEAAAALAVRADAERARADELAQQLAAAREDLAAVGGWSLQREGATVERSRPRF